MAPATPLNASARVPGARPQRGRAARTQHMRARECGQAQRAPRPPHPTSPPCESLQATVTLWPIWRCRQNSAACGPKLGSNLVRASAAGCEHTLRTAVKKAQPSRTAEYMAFFRAVELRRPAGRRLFSDPFAARVLDRPLRAAASLWGVPVLGGLVPGCGSPLAGPPPVAVARTRVIDDWLSGRWTQGSTSLWCSEPDTTAARSGSSAPTASATRGRPPDTQAPKRDLLEASSAPFPARAAGARGLRA